MKLTGTRNAIRMPLNEFKEYSIAISKQRCMENGWKTVKDKTGIDMVYYKNIPVDEIIYCIGELSISNDNIITLEDYYDDYTLRISRKLLENKELAKRFYRNYLIMADKYELVNEEDMKKTENLSFGKALELIKEGKRLRRDGWHNKKGYVIYSPRTDDVSEHIVINIDGISVPWVASQTDLLSNDWRVI